MSVTAKQLSKSGAKGKDFDSIVREHLHIIDDRLNRTERIWGRNVVPHEIPTCFSFPGLDKKDAQRIIYSAIIRSLQERGFSVRLLLESDRTVVYTEWVTDIASEEVNAMNRLIRDARITPDQLEAFLQRDTISTDDIPPDGKDPPAGPRPLSNAAMPQ